MKTTSFDVYIQAAVNQNIYEPQIAAIIAATIGKHTRSLVQQAVDGDSVEHTVATIEAEAQKLVRMVVDNQAALSRMIEYAKEFRRQRNEKNQIIAQLEADLNEANSREYRDVQAHDREIVRLRKELDEAVSLAYNDLLSHLQDVLGGYDADPEYVRDLLDNLIGAAE